MSDNPSDLNSLTNFELDGSLSEISIDETENCIYYHFMTFKALSDTGLVLDMSDDCENESILEDAGVANNTCQFYKSRNGQETYSASPYEQRGRAKAHNLLKNS